MDMTVDDKVFAQDLSQMRCEMTSPGVEECALCASSAHDVHHASVCVNVIIGVLVVLCELHQRLQINLCLYQVALIDRLPQQISQDLNVHTMSSPGLMKLKKTRTKASSRSNSS